MMIVHSRVPAGVPTGGQFAASARDESRVSLDSEAAPEVQEGEFSTTWPTLRASDRQWGTVRTTNGGEVSGYLSTHGSTYGVDVETDTGHFVGITGWRVAGVRLEERPPGPFDTDAGTTDAVTVFAHLSPTDGTDWTSLRTEYNTEHPVVMAALRDDLLRNGMKTPIVVRDGKVENGQHRILAASDVGVPIKWAAWTGNEPKVYWDPESREHYGPEDDEDGEGQLRY